MKELFERNQEWAGQITKEDPGFFEQLSKQQAPEYLWIGCADSRVPANEIVGMLPGELFVHRNVANVVVHSDLNCLSVLQYAVDVLKVKHIIVCGHYGCGGVRAALEDSSFGLIDNWLQHVQDVKFKHIAHVDKVSDPSVRADMMCELNVIEQVLNVAKTSILREAWQRGQQISVHGWVYGLKDGLIQGLDMKVEDFAGIRVAYDTALSKLEKKYS